MRAIVAMLFVVLASIACQGSQVPSPGASTEASSSSTDTSSSTSSSAESLEPTNSADPTAIVQFTKVIPDKQWGDPTFKATATAAAGATVTYAAHSAGACTVDPSTAAVQIVAVGDCSITATATLGAQTGQDSVSFAITKASPDISFVAQNVPFQRPFKAVPLNATSKPAIPLKYRVIPTGTEMDDFCGVTQAGALVLKQAPTPTKFPQLDGDCKIEVSAAETSPNYTTPAPHTRTIRINRPKFDVRTTSTTVSVATDRQVSIAIRENSGDAFGIQVDLTNDDGNDCSVVRTTPENAPAGTTKYTVTLSLRHESSQYKCTFHAQAEPPDWQGGRFEDSFTVTVKP